MFITNQHPFSSVKKRYSYPVVLCYGMARRLHPTEGISPSILIVQISCLWTLRDQSAITVLPQMDCPQVNSNHGMHCVTFICTVLTKAKNEMKYNYVVIEKCNVIKQ